MLPYTFTLILGWLLTLAACLPATTTPTTPEKSSAPQPNLDGLRSLLEPVRSAWPTAAPTSTTEDGDAIVARQEAVPAYTPIVTPSPNQDEELASLGWRQTTFYECRTRGGNEHCGWRTPVMRAAGERVGVRGWMGGLVVLGAWFVM